MSGMTYGTLSGAVCDGSCSDVGLFVAEISPRDGDMLWAMQFAGIDMTQTPDHKILFDKPFLVDGRNVLYVAYGQQIGEQRTSYIRKI